MMARLFGSFFVMRVVSVVMVCVVMVYVVMVCVVVGCVVVMCGERCLSLQH